MLTLPQSLEYCIFPYLNLERHRLAIWLSSMEEMVQSPSLETMLMLDDSLNPRKVLDSPMD